VGVESIVGENDHAEKRKLKMSWDDGISQPSQWISGGKGGQLVPRALQNLDGVDSTHGRGFQVRLSSQGPFELLTTPTNRTTTRICRVKKGLFQKSGTLPNKLPCGELGATQRGRQLHWEVELGESLSTKE